MTETNSTTESERGSGARARGKAFLAQIRRSSDFCLRALPSKASIKTAFPTKPNPHAAKHWKQANLTAQMINLMRLSAASLLIVVLALAVANITVSVRPNYYVASPARLRESAAQDVEAKVGQNARADDLAMFVTTVVPRLKSLNYANPSDLPALQGLVHPDLLQQESDYQRSTRTAVVSREIVQQLTVDPNRIEHYVYNAENERISLEITGSYRISGRTLSGPLVKDLGFHAKLVLRMVPISSSNAFGFILIDLEEL